MDKVLIVGSDVSAIKKNFPAAGLLLGRKISSVTTSTTDNLNSNTPNTQTNVTGVKQITLTPLTNPILFSWDAPNGTVAKSWLDNTTTADADVLQYVYIPAGATYTKTFSSPVYRWDLVAVTGATAVYQEVSL
jgi:hypothetical protein